MKPSELSEHLFRVGYVARREELLALAGIISAPKGQGMRVLLLQGPPGTGKTFISQAFAKITDAKYVYTLLHNWSDSSELHVGVDVQAAVAGEADNVRQPGTLAVAARKSLLGPTVLCLDEVDKSNEQTEALLLDFLQTGRVPIQPGKHVTADPENLIVFMTSNAMRPLSDALYRRARRLNVKPLPAKVVIDIVVKQTKIPTGLVATVEKTARMVGESLNVYISPQEISRCCSEIYGVAESHQDVLSIITGWTARDSSATKKKIDPRFVIQKSREIYGMTKKARGW